MAYIRDTPTTVTIRTVLATVIALAGAVTLLVLASGDTTEVAVTSVVLVIGSLVVTWAVWCTDIMSIPADRSSSRQRALGSIGISVGLVVVAVTDGVEPVPFLLLGLVWLFVAIVNHNLRFLRERRQDTEAPDLTPRR